MNPEVCWQLLRMEDFTGPEMHEMLRIRCAVFVVEQRCFYQDPDEIDEKAMHLVGRENGRLVAYGRYFPEGDWTRLGRVLTVLDRRGVGLGRALIAKALDHIGQGPVLIFAQSHLQRLYSEFGFVAVGDEFLEDGIPHQRMERR
ncbi:MAG TPA: GNAT family N-acetyltransferase [Planctomycetota bacterium]|nr:GNAT family N-acetyltransferase [Planctomycetota bacterium]